MNEECINETLHHRAIVSASLRDLMQQFLFKIASGNFLGFQA